MRKRNIEKVADTVFWFGVYALPLIAYCIYLGQQGNGTIIDFGNFLQNMGLSIINNNVVYTALDSIFGANGILPTFASAGALNFFAYFVNCLILHLAVDVIAFIPRFAHKLIDNFARGVD